MMDGNSGALPAAGNRLLRTGLMLAALLVAWPGIGAALTCGNGPEGFGRWLAAAKAQAAKQGISQSAIETALAGVSYDATVIRLDRNQRSFKLSFEDFYKRRVGPALMRRAQERLNRYKAVFDRIDKQFGVPREVIVAIWGLETNFGADTSGKFSIIRSLATLAYDCRRSTFFTPQFYDAIRIVERRDMTTEQMRGGWAGEIGQTQFLPSPYIKYAVDYDGDGRRDLVNSVPDILASTASFLKGHGWQRGGSYEPGTANYGVIRDWNRAEVYQRTISVMASRLRAGS
jgi:lytic murein transglycosylase